MVRFTRNPDYFVNGLPYLDGLEIYSLPDDAALHASFMARQTNWLWLGTLGGYGYFDEYVAHPEIETVTAPSRFAYRIRLKSHVHPFNNTRVRQAILKGIDREEAI